MVDHIPRQHRGDNVGITWPSNEFASFKDHFNCSIHLIVLYLSSELVCYYSFGLEWRALRFTKAPVLGLGLTEAGAFMGVISEEMGNAMTFNVPVIKFK